MHVLSLPPAFVLSQDQTLKFNHDMVAECTFAFDEDTHLICLQSENCDKVYVPLRKRAPIESLVTTSTGIASSFSSQEPRRPRFSFFFSSQCQRADPSPSPADTSVRTFSFSMFLQRNTILPRLPGRSSALSDCADQWECLALTSSTLAGSNRDI